MNLIGYTLDQALEKTDNGIILTFNDYDLLTKAWEFVDHNEKQLAIARDNSEERIKEIMHHDPDVIYMKTLKNTDDVRMACRAANTGHLVLAKLNCKRNSGDLEEEIKSWKIDKDYLDALLLGVIYNDLLVKPYKL